MKIVEELAVLRRRIDEIAAGPHLPDMTFGDVVSATYARSSDARSSSTLGVSRLEIDRLVRTSAADYNVDPALIDAVIENESGFDSNATSAAGARGLMQLMPETAIGLGVTNSYDAAQNIRAGTRYLRSLLDRFGNLELAVAAYNAGPNAVQRYGRVPPYAQTQSYVRNVLASYRRSSQLGNLATNAGSQPNGTIVP